jgi:hypothetical protein
MNCPAKPCCYPAPDRFRRRDLCGSAVDQRRCPSVRRGHRGIPDTIFAPPRRVALSTHSLDRISPGSRPTEFVFLRRNDPAAAELIHLSCDTFLRPGHEAKLVARQSRDSDGGRKRRNSTGWSMLPGRLHFGHPCAGLTKSNSYGDRAAFLGARSARSRLTMGQ